MPLLLKTNPRTSAVLHFDHSRSACGRFLCGRSRRGLKAGGSGHSVPLSVALEGRVCPLSLCPDFIECLSSVLSSVNTIQSFARRRRLCTNGSPRSCVVNEGCVRVVLDSVCLSLSLDSFFHSRKSSAVRPSVMLHPLFISQHNCLVCLLC